MNTKKYFDLGENQYVLTINITPILFKYEVMYRITNMFSAEVVFEREVLIGQHEFTSEHVMTIAERCKREYAVIYEMEQGHLEVYKQIHEAIL